MYNTVYYYLRCLFYYFVTSFYSWQLPVLKFYRSLPEDSFIVTSFLDFFHSLSWFPYRPSCKVPLPSRRRFRGSVIVRSTQVSCRFSVHLYFPHSHISVLYSILFIETSGWLTSPRPTEFSKSKRSFVPLFSSPPKRSLEKVKDVDPKREYTNFGCLDLLNYDWVHCRVRRRPTVDWEPRRVSRSPGQWILVVVVPTSWTNWSYSVGYNTPMDS